MFSQFLCGWYDIIGILLGKKLAKIFCVNTQFLILFGYSEKNVPESLTNQYIAHIMALHLQPDKRNQWENFQSQLYDKGHNFEIANSPIFNNNRNLTVDHFGTFLKFYLADNHQKVYTLFSSISSLREMCRLAKTIKRKKGYY